MSHDKCNGFHKGVNRRRFLEGAAGTALAASLWPTAAYAAESGDLNLRVIPSSGEEIPPVGLGSWITFNVGNNAAALANSTSVIRAFFDAGGRLIDSSPMYGSSQATIGQALAEIDPGEQLFSAEKVWTRRGGQGATQIEDTRSYWGVPSFDLLQVHNLLAWEQHLETLYNMKAEGHLRYVGVTTSHGRRHGTLEDILATQDLDFVQLTYNMQDREVEDRLLPLARERGIAVICNRPYGGGRLIRQAKENALPVWAGEMGVTNWPQFLLKYITSHPAVTCAIPATSQVAHVRENLSAAHGPTLTDAERGRLLTYFQSL